MFRRLSVTFLALAMLGVAGRQATASFTFVNDASIATAIANNQFGSFSFVSSNGSNLTVDNDTNLQWLDVSVTRGLSRDAVTTRMAAGGVLEGFRWATTAELTGFMNKNGVTVPEVATGAAAGPKVAYAEAFSNIWGGNLWQTILSNSSIIYGRYATSDGNVQLYYGTFNQAPSYEAFSTTNTFSGAPDTGHALVRTSSAVIPEPSGVLLFAIGSCLLPSLRLRQRQG